MQTDDIFKETQSEHTSRVFQTVYKNEPGLSAEDLETLNKNFSSQFMGITWFTYRDGLEETLASSNINSDGGWGCMLRTGQMILMQVLKRHVIGRDFEMGMLSDLALR